MSDIASRGRFPRLYAAASLKLALARHPHGAGLRFPRLYAAASLKRVLLDERLGEPGQVFRGFMPRPH